MNILLSAYACEPGKGSEAEIGWRAVLAASTGNEVWVLTRRANRPAIQQADIPLQNVRFEYLDLPDALLRLKRGPLGVHLYYRLWQRIAHRRARALNASVHFDVAHHVTFASFVLPVGLGGLGIPLIWGPVGGGETAPPCLLRGLSMKGRAFELTRNVIRYLAQSSPRMKALAREAKLVLASTPETAARLSSMGAVGVIVRSQVAVEMLKTSCSSNEASDQFLVVSVARLEEWKGVHLSIRAFHAASIPGSRLVIVGEGPQRRRLEALTRRLGISGRVEFLGAVSTADVRRIMAPASAMLLPSLHDSGGIAVVEAMSHGVPPVVLKVGGPGLIVDGSIGVAIVARSEQQTIADLAAALVLLAQDSATARVLGRAAQSRVEQSFTWESSIARSQEMYSSVGGRC